MRHYFSQGQRAYRIRKEIREKVLFAKHSLLPIRRFRRSI
jgi:two-component system CheB/CheR fusion protein